MMRKLGGEDREFDPRFLRAGELDTELNQKVVTALALEKSTAYAVAAF